MSTDTLPKHKGVSRMHGGPKTRPGWLARAYRNAAAVSKGFADAEHGSPEAAYAAACAWQERTDQALPASDPEPNRGEHSNTGVPGVSRTTLTSGSGFREPCFEVSYTDGGQPKRKKFQYQAADDRSERDAFEKACAFNRRTRAA